MAFTIGERIEQYRNAADLTQEQLGDAVGVSKQAISNYEKNRRIPGHDTILQMADVLGRKYSDSAADVIRRKIFGRKLF